MKILLIVAALFLQNTVLADEPSPFCEEQKARLLESIKQGFITCEAAKEFYAKLGCGELKCE